MVTFPREQQSLNKKSVRADGWHKVGTSLKVRGSYFKLFEFTRRGASQEDLGACLLARHVALSPSNLRHPPPVQPTHPSARHSEMDSKAFGVRNLLGAGQINLKFGI